MRNLAPVHPRLRCRSLTGRLRGFVAFAALVCFAHASPAAADSTLIEFDFTANSFISILGGVIVTPPDGTMDSGSARLEIEATDATSFVGGGFATLDLLNFAGTVAKNVAGVADIAGPYSGAQVGSLGGNLNLGLDEVTFGSDLMVDLNVVFGCTGSGCGTLGFPISEVGISALTMSALPIADLEILGGASIQTAIPLTLDGVQGVLNLHGVEVSRSFVPEPGTFASVAIGLAMLAGSRRRVGRCLSHPSR